jgi:hypothetical protein
MDVFEFISVLRGEIKLTLQSQQANGFIDPDEIDKVILNTLIKMNRAKHHQSEG